MRRQDHPPFPFSQGWPFEALGELSAGGQTSRFSRGRGPGTSGSLEGQGGEFWRPGEGPEYSDLEPQGAEGSDSWDPENKGLEPGSWAPDKLGLRVCLLSPK